MDDPVVPERFASSADAWKAGQSEGAAAGEQFGTLLVSLWRLRWPICFGAACVAIYYVL